MHAACYLGVSRSAQWWGQKRHSVGVWSNARLEAEPEAMAGVCFLMGLSMWVAFNIFFLLFKY